MLNCAIMGNGEIDPRAIELYQAIGKWMKHSGESLIGTIASPFSERPEWGNISMSKSADVIYLHILQWPPKGVITLKGISTEADDMYFLASAGSKLEFELSGQTLNITLPSEPVDELNTVIKIEMKEGFRVASVDHTHD